LNITEGAHVRSACLYNKRPM